MGSNKSKVQAKEEICDVDGSPADYNTLVQTPIPKSNIPSVPFLVFVVKEVTIQENIPHDIVRCICNMLKNTIDLQYVVSTLFPEHFSASNPHGIKSPYGVLIDYSNGDLIFSEFHSHYVRKIDKEGNFILVVGKGVAGATDGAKGVAEIYSPAGICLDKNRDILITDFNNHLLRRCNVEDYSVKTINTGSYKLKMPSGICLDYDDTIVFNDCHNHNIKRIKHDGSIEIIAGDPSCNFGFADGLGTEARFRHPAGICTDGKGTIYVTDHWNHCIRKIDKYGNVTTVAGTGIKGSTDHTVTMGYHDGVKEAAKFNSPQGIAYHRGELFVADMSNHCIRKISLDTGEVKTIAGSTTAEAGDLTKNGNGMEARFYHPIGMFAERDGCILVADASNHGIRRLTPQWCDL